ncbi:MAG: hypothetical protein HKN13_06125 [Rhodothermales bacterium]|nr:hypothetical protein [Rhodothermales bacterium]
MSDAGMGGIKELRYYVMLALYFPILLYAFSTFDLDEDTYAVKGIEPIVVAEEVVVLGQPFEAKTFLIVSGGQGQKLVGDDGLSSIGDTLFTMNTGDILAPGESEKVVEYSGRYNFTQIGGETVELPVRGQFKVKRPDIVATSESMSALYRRSRNAVRIDVPGLENRELRLQLGKTSVTGRSITVSPSGNDVTVRVFMLDETNGDVFLGSKQFVVIDPPRPELSVTNAGRKINNGDNLPRARASLEFKVEPDQEFARRYPKDARYRVGKATVYLRKGLTASKKVGSFDLNGNKLVLTRALRGAKPGDRVLIELEGISRINHEGSSIPVQLGESSRTFGFVVS